MTIATAIVAGHGITFRRSLHLPNPPRKPCSASFTARLHAHYGRMAVPATPPSPRPCQSISSESPMAATADTIEDEEDPPYTSSARRVMHHAVGRGGSTQGEGHLQVGETAAVEETSIAGHRDTRMQIGG